MAGFQAYVGDFREFQVNSINTASDTITAVIGAVGSYTGHFQLNVNYTDTLVAIADFNHNQISFIDVPTQTYDPNVIVTPNPIAVGWTLDSTHVYMSGTNQITPGDVTTFTPGTPIPVAGAGQFTDCAITPDGQTFLFCSGTLLAFIDIATNTLLSTIAGDFFGGVAVTPNGQKAYCGQFSGGVGDQVAIIDVPTRTQTGTIHLGGTPWPNTPRFTPDGTQCLITGNNDNSLHFITVATDTPGTVITGGHFGGPEFLAITPDGLKAYVANQTTQIVSVIDVVGQAWLTNIAVPNANTLYGIAIVPPPPTPPPTPSYPGAQFIPKLFIPIKGKQSVDYTRDELRANWLAIEVWSQRWIPPPTVALLIPHKNDPSAEGVNANWITLEVWGQVIKNLGAPYTPLFVPRKTSRGPSDLDIDFLAVQNWANRLPK